MVYVLNRHICDVNVAGPCMDKGYKELRLRGSRPSPWRIESIPKFADVPGRKFDCYRDKESRDGEAPTPPPSPIGAFKYPALFRGNNVWPKTKSIEAILTETCKCSSQIMTKPLTGVHDSVAAEIKPSQKEQPQPLQDLLENVKPAGGQTKMHLWSQPQNTYCPKLDLSSLTVASSPKGVCRPSIKAGVKESSNSIKAGHKMMERCFKTIPTNNFDVILKHALSHDPVMAKHSSAPQIQRSMTFANKPAKGEKGFPIMKQ